MKDRSQCADICSACLPWFVCPADHRQHSGHSHRSIGCNRARRNGYSRQQSETGLSRTVITDRNGGYVVLELPVGHYQLQVTAKGFQEYVQDGISLSVNETASVSPHLAIGSEIRSGSGHLRC